MCDNRELWLDRSLQEPDVLDSTVYIYIFILDTRWCSQNFVSAHTTASLLMKLDLESGIWLSTASNRPHWRGWHYALAVLWVVGSSGIVRYWAEKWCAHSQIPLAFSVLVLKCWRSSILYSDCLLFSSTFFNNLRLLNNKFSPNKPILC
jgi:hypothetical protein